MKEKFFISLISQFSSKIIYIFTFYLLFLNLDINHLGIWVFLTSVINLGFLFMDKGLLDVVHFQYSGKTDLSEYFGSFFILKIIFMFINLLITILIILFLQVEELLIISFLIFDTLLSNIIIIFVSNLQSKIKTYKSEIPSLIFQIGKCISILYLILNLQHISGPILYLSISNFIFDIFFLLVIIIISKKDFKINKPRKKFILNYVKDIKPFLFSSIVSILASNLGLIILKFTLGNVILGYVGFVTIYIIPILSSITYSMASVYFPLFSIYFKENKINSIKNISQIIERYSSILYLTIIIIVFLNGELIFSIFFPKYMNSISILYFMIFIPYFIGIAQPYSYILISGNKQKINALINSINSILIILMMIIFIPNIFLGFQTLGLGTIGYALSQTIPWIFWSIFCYLFCYKYFKIYSQKKMLLHMPLAILSLLISIVIKNSFLLNIFQNPLTLLIASSIIMVIIFYFFLFLFKILRKEDLILIKQMFELRTHINSIKEEMS